MIEYILNPFILGFKMIAKIYSWTWWFVLPPVLFSLFKLLWMKYVHGNYLRSLKYVLLEIKPPRDIERSPRTMEQVFAALHGCWSSPNKIDEYIRGKLQAYFSFEIQGINGEMHMYIRCEEKFRNFVESLIWAQYPDAEINQVEDYTLSVPKNCPNAEWDLWGVDYKLVKEDAYPIRTYHKFVEDVTGKMIDPLASVADVIAALPPGQQIWIQMIVTPVRDDEWKDSVKKLANKLAKRSEEVQPNIFQKVMGVFSVLWRYLMNLPEPAKTKEERPIELLLTSTEKEVLKAVEESMNKKAMRVKLRWIYIGKREGFDRGFLSGINGAIHQFNDLNLNSFTHDNTTKTYANYLFAESRLRWAQRKIFTRYLDRDDAGPTFILNSEELATVWHLPDMSVASPAIERVEAKKGAAPVNLPVA